MSYRSSIGAVTLAAVLTMAAAATHAFDESKYPDLTGQWTRIGSGSYDPSKPASRGQQPPLTAEYQAIWREHLAEEAAGGQDYNPQVRCMPGGMPRMMIAYEPMEVILRPEATFIFITFNNSFRRIYTDGRDWPKEFNPSFPGYSIGKWIDEGGRYTVLEVETRGMKGPRIFDASGIPLHKDNRTVVKERIYLDKVDPDILRDEITTFDNALTRPWTVTRSYRRDRNPNWFEAACGENNQWVFIGKDSYVLSADGRLMPVRKNQAPPDLSFFNQSPKLP